MKASPARKSVHAGKIFFAIATRPVLIGGNDEAVIAYGNCATWPNARGLRTHRPLAANHAASQV